MDAVVDEEKSVDGKVRPTDGIRVDTLAAKSLEMISSHLTAYETAYLMFSGGKESIVLGDLLEPWRSKVALVWANTALTAPHMREFVRRYAGDRGFALIDLPAGNPTEAWATWGVPSALLAPTLDGHRMMLVQDCCTLHFGVARGLFESIHQDALFIDGVREEDGIRPHDHAPVSSFRAEDRTYADQHRQGAINYIRPLWAWNEDDVLSYARLEGTTLPLQYREGLVDSLECLACPGRTCGARMAFLRRHYPKAADFVRDATLANLRVLMPVWETYRAALDGEVFVTPG